MSRWSPYPRVVCTNPDMRVHWVPVLGGLYRVLGGLYRVLGIPTRRAPSCPGSKPTSGAGPGSPARGLEWVGGCSGRYWVRSRVRSPQTTHSGPTWDLRGPLRCLRPARGGTLAVAAKGRHFSIFSIKLVKTPKCHRKVLKRPVIVPISKTASESQLLKFQDFQFSQPSLTRN